MAKTLSSGDLALFTDQLAALSRSGLPLSQSLEALSQDVDKKEFKELVLHVQRDIEQGETLSNALSKRDKEFPQYYIKLVECGEKGGNLPEVLADLAAFCASSAEQKARFKEAMLYPEIVGVFAIAVFLFIMVVIVPGIAEMREPLAGAGNMYGGLGGAVIRLSFFMRSNVLALAALVTAIVGAIAVTVAVMKSSASNRRRFDRAKYRVPLLRGVIRDVSLARFCRTLGALLGRGVPVLDAIDLTAAAIPNTVFADAAAGLKAQVKEGAAVSAAMSESRLFPHTLVWMASAGEERGQLDVSLQRLGEFYDRQAEYRVTILNNIIEPGSVLVIALFIGIVIISGFWSLFGGMFGFADLLSGPGGGG